MRDSLRGLTSDLHEEDDYVRMLQRGRGKDAIAWVILAIVVALTLASCVDWRAMF